MIQPSIIQLMLEHDGSPIIPAEQCATVRPENTLLHALMLLSTVGHSEIPVVDPERHTVGVISMPLILEGIKTATNYDWQDLDEHKVGEVMRTHFGRTPLPLELEDILHGLVNFAYLCVEDERGRFAGIITRKEMLTRINYLVHSIGAVEPMEHYLEKYAAYVCSLEDRNVHVG